MTTPPAGPTPSTPQPAGPPPYPAGGQRMGPPQGAAQQPAGYAYAPSASERRANPFGLVSIIAGAVLILSNIVQIVVQASIVTGGDYETLGIAGGIGTLSDGFIALVAVVFGIIGVVQRGRSHVLAGIGLGIGIATLTTALLWGVIYPLVLSFA